MAVTVTGRELLYSLRKARSRSLLFQVPETFFAEGDEQQSIEWLRQYVADHKSFPSREVMAKETGVKYAATSEPATYYIDRARKRALYQNFLPNFGELRAAMESKDPDAYIELIKEAQRIGQSINAQREGIVDISDALALVKEDYEIAMRTVGLRGIPTGFPYLDEVTDGWQNSDLITLVARPGRGKTWLALFMAFEAWMEGRNVLFLSMEMGVLQIARRWVGIYTGYNPRLIQRGLLSTRARRRFYNEIETVPDNARFCIMAGNFKKSTDALRAAAEELQPDLIVADASYLLQPSKRSKEKGRRENVADVIEELKTITLDMNRPILQTVQFNRTAVKSGKGSEESTNPLSHLGLHKIGETDVIGQSSSIVVGAELGDAPNESMTRYLGLLKGREGEEGWIKINYLFQPFNFRQIMTDRDNADRRTAAEPVDLSYMDTQV